jgi:hypothetical protein
MKKRISAPVDVLKALRLPTTSTVLVKLGSDRVTSANGSVRIG